MPGYNDLSDNDKKAFDAASDFWYKKELQNEGQRAVPRIPYTPGERQARLIVAPEELESKGAELQSEIDRILEARNKTYGSFKGHAELTQRLKYVFQTSPKWGQLAADQTECLEMIAHKIGRILNGDPNYLDSWVDIEGYTKLVVDRMKKTQEGKSNGAIGAGISDKVSLDQNR